MKQKAHLGRLTEAALPQVLSVFHRWIRLIPTVSVPLFSVLFCLRRLVCFLCVSALCMSTTGKSFLSSPFTLFFFPQQRNTIKSLMCSSVLQILAGTFSFDWTQSCSIYIYIYFTHFWGFFCVCVFVCMMGKVRWRCKDKGLRNMRGFRLVFARREVRHVAPQPRSAPLRARRRTESCLSDATASWLAADTLVPPVRESRSSGAASARGPLVHTTATRVMNKTETQESSRDLDSGAVSSRVMDVSFDRLEDLVLENLPVSLSHSQSFSEPQQDRSCLNRVPENEAGL